jgi:putative PIN family toxin of toxin-antitoxin system
MKRLEVVIDTNVLVSALKSKRGASFRLLTLIGQNKFNVNLSVPLILEYEDVSRTKLIPHPRGQVNSPLLP